MIADPRRSLSSVAFLPRESRMAKAKTQRLTLSTQNSRNICENCSKRCLNGFLQNKSAQTNTLHNVRMIDWISGNETIVVMTTLMIMSLIMTVSRNPCLKTLTSEKSSYRTPRLSCFLMNARKTKDPSSEGIGFSIWYFIRNLKCRTKRKSINTMKNIEAPKLAQDQLESKDRDCIPKTEKKMTSPKHPYICTIRKFEVILDRCLSMLQIRLI